jgi:uncharacterized protein (TIGR02598 family)
MNRCAWVKNRPSERPFSSDGFSLLEIVIAIAVVSVTFVGIIGLLGLGLASDETSSEQTSATNIADSIISDFRSTPSYSSTGKSTRFGITLPTTTPGSAATPLAGLTPALLYFDASSNFISLGGAAPASAIYVARVYSTQINPFLTDKTKTSYLVRVAVSWPAAAAIPVGNLEVITQFSTH